MEKLFSTRQVSQLLAIRGDYLQKAIWHGRLKPPQKSPSGNYLWTITDIQRASWLLLGKGYDHKEVK